MKHILLIYTVLLLSLNVFSQKTLLYDRNLSAHMSYLDNNFGITYKIPQKLKKIDKYYVMWKVSNNLSKHSGSMYGPFFLSKDKECIVAYPTMPHSISKQEKKRLQSTVGNFPRDQIISEIKTALGFYYHYGCSLNNDTAKFNFNDYVTIIAGKKPREMFNADSIYIYNLPNADSVYFFDESIEKMRKNKYPYCTGMFISKNGRATIDIKFFFTKKGEKKKDQYIEMLNKHIWYDEKFHHY